MEQVSSNSRKKIRILMYLILAGILIWTFYQNSRPQREAGELEFRMITGVENGLFQIIMIETIDRFTIPDSSFRHLFTENTAEIVSRQEHMQLMDKYDDLQFRAGFHLRGSMQKAVYRLSREQFNALSFVKVIDLEIDRRVRDSISFLR